MKQKLYFFLLLVLTQLNVFSQSGTHLNFDGVNDYVALANDFNLTDNFTFEAWIKTGVDGIIIHNDTDYDRSDFKIKNGKLTYETARLGYGGYILASNTTVSDNTWHHVAITMNLTTANNVCKLYIDGVLEASHTFIIYSVPIGSLIIGSYQYSSSFFNGDIDEVRIWNVIRTETEINSTKDTEIPCNAPGLVGYYQFNKGISGGLNTNASRFIDVSANDHNGTLINFALAGTTSNWLSGSPIASLSSPPLAVSPVTYAINDIAVTLTATPGLNGTSLLWYTDMVGGLGTTTLIPSTTTIGSTNYYVSSVTTNGCESERTAVVVVVTPLPIPTAKNPQVYSGSATIANLTATGNNLLWYTESTGGTALLSTTALVDGTTYYVASSSGNAESLRAAVKVRRISAASQIFCSGATIANLVVTPTSGSTASWFSNQTGGTALLGTSLLSSGNYYVEQTGTETSNRILVTVFLEYAQIPTVATPVLYTSGETTLPLTATSGEEGLLWYTAATGGTGATTAPTPSSTVLGNTSYWVSSTKANGCESPRVEIVVRVVGEATNLNFDGNDDFVTIGAIIAPAASYTKEAMIKPNAVNGSYNILSSAGDVFWISNFGIRAGHTNNFSHVSASAVSLFNSWNHVAVTYDAPTTTMRLYVNGVLVSENTSVPASAGNTIQIGAYADAALFNGGIDEVRIWNKALTAAEIVRRKNCELQGSENGLLAYYKFNQGQANLSNDGLTSLTDSSPNSNTGTLSGFELNNSTSNYSVGSPITTGVAVPTAPTVTSLVNYNVGSSASPLTTNSGTGLLWYTVSSGGTSYETAITPNTTTVGNTSYWVSSSNENGCESERVEIVVTIDPVQVTITNQPANSTIVGGTNADFSVVAEGTDVSYQWQVSHDGGITFTDLTNDGIYSGVTSATLTLTNVPISMDGKQYKVKVSNGSEAVSNAAALTVNTPSFNNNRFWKNKGIAGFSAGAAADSYLALDANNTPYVAFRDDSNGEKTSVMKFDGTSWVLVGGAGFSETNFVYSFSMVFDASNMPYVAYLNANNLIEVKYFNGTSWTNVGVSGLESEAEGLSLKMDPSGVPFVAYTDYSANYKTTVRKLVGNNWVLVGDAGFSAGESYDTSFAIDPQGTPYVVYRDDSNDGKATAMKFDGTAWVNVGPSSGFSPDVAFYTSLAIDRAGTPYATFVDFFTDQPVVMKFNGSEWVMVGTPGFASGVLYTSSIALDGSGTPFLVYQDFDDSNKVTVKRFNGTSWTTVGASGFSMGVGNFTAIDLDSSGTPYVVFIDATLGDKVTVMKFNGSNEQTIWENGNWDNGVPNLTMKALIDDALVLSSDISANALEVTTNGSITVATGTVLTVAGKITNNNTPAHFVVEDHGILLQQQDVQNEGDITVQVNSFPLYRQDYTLWSSPVMEQNLRGFSPNTLYNRFSSYDTAAGSTGQYVQEIFTALDVQTKVFQPAKGYLIRMPNNWGEYVEESIAGMPYQGSFSGIPQNGPVSIGLSTANTGGNLVGNPYPSPISIDLFLEGNPDIEQTLYYWRKRNDQSGTGYATYNALGLVSPQPAINGLDIENVINPGQGFFVITNGATQLHFNNAMRSTNTEGTFLKNPLQEKHRFWLGLSSSTGTVGQTLIGYVTGATEGVDNGFDGAYFNDSATALTSLINGNEYAIQGLSLPFEPTEIVPLGFKTSVAGNYSISLSNFDGLFSGDQAIFIKDYLNGEVHNLKTSDYSFTTDSGVFNDRFVIVYQTTLGTDNPTMNINNTVVFKQYQDIHINAWDVLIKKIELYDIRGRLIHLMDNVNQTKAIINNLNIANQVLIVKVTSDEHKTITKKIIY